MLITNNLNVEAMFARHRAIGKKKMLYQHTVRFFPSGMYNWIVPAGCTYVDVFLVGGGGCGWQSYGDTNNSTGAGGGAGGYTNTFLNLPVSPGLSIPVIVGAGGVAGTASASGGFSQFLNTSYRANGGSAANQYYGANGGSGSGAGGGAKSGSSANGGSGGSNGNNGGSAPGLSGGIGQGITTRDFGEPSGKINAGGGGGGSVPGTGIGGNGGFSDYGNIDGAANGTGTNNNYGKAGGGYGGGGGGGGAEFIYGATWSGGRGGDGTVLIRFYSYQKP